MQDQATAAIAMLANLPVVHHEQLKLLDVVHGVLQETVGQDVPGLLVRAVADVGHRQLALEPAQ